MISRLAGPQPGDPTSFVVCVTPARPRISEMVALDPGGAQPWKLRSFDPSRDRREHQLLSIPANLARSDCHFGEPVTLSFWAAKLSLRGLRLSFWAFVRLLPGIQSTNLDCQVVDQVDARDCQFHPSP